jgi:hypothetical protein
MLVLALGAWVAPGAALAENDMCDGRTAQSAAAELAASSGPKVVRVLIKLKTPGGADRAALDRDSSALAETLKRAGAYSAAPIGGQPLVVAELDKERLVEVAKDPRVACITQDVPGKAY